MSLYAYLPTLNKRLSINRLKIPVELCHIIKSYLFYDSESMKFIKMRSSKKNELPLIKKAWSRNNCSLFNGVTPDSPHWVWGFTDENNSQQLEYIQFQGENCHSCGEYAFISYTSNPHLQSKLPICFCIDIDEHIFGQVDDIDEHTDNEDEYDY
jgi:hypothetical protein